MPEGPSMSREMRGVRRAAPWVHAALMVLALWGVGLAGSGPEPACRVVRTGGRLELRSPSFSLELETAGGLRALSWTNKLTGKTLSLEGGPELEVDLGPLQGPTVTPSWQVASVEPTKEGAEAELTVRLSAREPALSAAVTYWWSAREPVLHKLAQVSNEGDREVLLRDVRLGSYKTEARIAEREQGFPVYLDGEFFLSLAHPAGWATGKDGQVSLRQYPGRKLAPKERFACMEAVYGVGGGSVRRGRAGDDVEAAGGRAAGTAARDAAAAKAGGKAGGDSVAEAGGGGARETFVAHIKSRMRRVVRKHDRPYAIFDNFASWSMEADPGLFTQNSEERMLPSLGRLAASQEATGCRFDICNIHFWVDHAGDLKRFDPQRFPHGIAPIKERLDRLGVRPGLWIDSSMIAWSIGRNPAAAPSLSEDPGWFCRASEPIRSMYREAFLHHIRENGVRLIKFDNLRTVCNSASHGHLPGVYSTEAIENSVIEFLHDLDAACPDVFLILYWGHRSPWWLLHGDTLFDSGIGIEAAHPSSQPSLHARDSITQRLDQAQRYCRDLPPLGKDSLGVWLSDWGWNSSVGKERWQEGFVMDMCRGSLLAQLWADHDWLSPPEWVQMADFMALLRARPDCFGSPRFILGDPWKDEPYGYSCSDGRRAFIAIHNCTWRDGALELRLGAAWGLPDGERWDLYRWHPAPARLKGEGDSFGEVVPLALRPFEIVLLEAVPAGEQPTLERKLEQRPIPAGFAEATRAVALKVLEPEERARAPDDPRWIVLRPKSAASAGGARLAVQPDGSVLASGDNPSPDTYTITAETDLTGITAIRLEVLPDPSLPAGGPGRVYNGNFALREFLVTAEPRRGQAAPAPVGLHRPAADFSQTGHGGFPIAGAIDGDPRTAWSIDPQEGFPHAAIFETKAPFGVAGGTALTFKLEQGYLPPLPGGHTIGRLRLSVTAARPPIALPEGYGKRPLIVRAEVPPTRTGGVLAIAAEFRRGDQAVSLGDVGKDFSSKARLAGQAAECVPVLGQNTYPSSWQAWRVEMGPSDAARTLELSISASVPGDLQLSFRGFFVPK